MLIAEFINLYSIDELFPSSKKFCSICFNVEYFVLIAEFINLYYIDELIPSSKKFCSIDQLEIEQNFFELGISSSI